MLQPVASDATPEDGTKLVDWLSSSKAIIHVGSTLSAESPRDGADNGTPSPRFKVKMAEPATSGYVDKSSTRVVLVQTQTWQEGHTNGVVGVPLASSDDDDSVYDIDERFLSNMVDSRVNGSIEVSILAHYMILS